LECRLSDTISSPSTLELRSILCFAIGALAPPRSKGLEPECDQLFDDAAGLRLSLALQRRLRRLVAECLARVDLSDERLRPLLQHLKSLIESFEGRAGCTLDMSAACRGKQQWFQLKTAVMNSEQYLSSKASTETFFSCPSMTDCGEVVSRTSKAPEPQHGLVSGSPVCSKRVRVDAQTSCASELPRDPLYRGLAHDESLHDRASGAFSAGSFEGSFVKCARLSGSKEAPREQMCVHNRVMRFCSSCSGCEHGKLRHHCSICNGCQHGRPRHSCDQCHGCPHGHLKQNCRKCVGCEHGKVISHCKMCRGCPHGKLKSQCKLCSGGCPHGKMKQSCALCVGCPHGKIKSQCTACSGCPHGRITAKCKHCNGCPHGHVKFNCPQCCGCPHGKLKKNCPTCYGCPHGKVKHVCAQCSGCVHGKVKSQCGLCNGCSHGKLRHFCAMCSGCAHGKVKWSCRACSGCPHGKLRRNCRHCSGCIHGRIKGKCGFCKGSTYTGVDGR